MRLTVFDVAAVAVGLLVGAAIAASMTNVTPPSPPDWIVEMEKRVKKMDEDHAARWPQK